MLKVAVKIKGFLRGARSSHFDNRNNSSPIVRHFSQQPIGYGSFVINFIMFQNDLSYVPETYKTIGKTILKNLPFLCVKTTWFTLKILGFDAKFYTFRSSSLFMSNSREKICENAEVLQINIANWRKILHFSIYFMIYTNFTSNSTKLRKFESLFWS